jgi:hypothetical protein
MRARAAIALLLLTPVAGCGGGLSKGELVAELSDPAIADMEELEPPDDLEADFEKFVASLRKQRDLTEEIGDAARDGDTARIEKLGEQAQRAQAEYRELSQEIGFKQCGGGS